MTVASTQTPSVEISSPGFFALFNALKARWARDRMIRQTRRELSRLSDRELADLGLHRAMIERVVYHAVEKNMPR